MCIRDRRIVCCADAINDTTFNVALNKPVFCSSVLVEWYGQYNGVPQLANDGSLETNAEAGGESNCYHSVLEDFPWWAVDLGEPMAVYRVDLTNRGDCCGRTKCTLV